MQTMDNEQANIEIDPKKVERVAEFLEHLNRVIGSSLKQLDTTFIMVTATAHGDKGVLLPALTSPMNQTDTIFLLERVLRDMKNNPPKKYEVTQGR